MSTVEPNKPIYYYDSAHDYSAACLNNELFVIDTNWLTEDEHRQIDAYPSDLASVLRGVLIRRNLIRPEIL